MSKLLIQQASGPYTDMLDITGEHHGAYAARHRFDFLELHGDVQFERSPQWNKIRLILMAFNLGYEFIVWLDADTLIVDPARCFAEGLPPGPPIGMCRHTMPWRNQPWHYNSGVMLIRNEALSRQFFEDVWRAGPVDHPWQEQVRILEQCDLEPGAVQMLDARWNCTLGINSSPNPVVLGWHGHGRHALPRIRNALLQFGRRNTPPLPNISEAETRLRQTLTGKTFRYCRIGFDERLLTLGQDGVVMEGARDCERFWDVREESGGICA